MNQPPRSPGRIVEIMVEDFTVLTGGGTLTVVVQNTGYVSADFSVCITNTTDHFLIDCCFY